MTVNEFIYAKQLYGSWQPLMRGGFALDILRMYANYQLSLSNEDRWELMRCLFIEKQEDFDRLVEKYK